MIFLFSFHGNGSFCLCRDIGGGQSVELQQRRDLAGPAKGILYADAKHRYGTYARERLADRTAQSADDVVLLRCDNGSRFGGGCREKLGIERLYRVNVDDLGGNPASSASLTIRPVATMVTSLPSASLIPRPSSNLYVLSS